MFCDSAAGSLITGAAGNDKGHKAGLMPFVTTGHTRRGTGHIRRGLGTLDVGLGILCVVAAHLGI